MFDGKVQMGQTNRRNSYMSIAMKLNIFTGYYNYQKIDFSTRIDQNLVEFMPRKNEINFPKFRMFIYRILLVEITYFSI